MVQNGEDAQDPGVARGQHDAEVPAQWFGEGNLRGRAVQVEPMKPILKARGTKRLKL
jgi:hypothetical protein